MFGWHGVGIKVDLSRDKISVEDLDETILKSYIGGRGLGAKILYDELKPNINPLDADNKLIFATGPLTGSGAPMTGRYCVVSKSPLTDTIFDSHSGGAFGVELKYTGYDTLIIEGKAHQPVYIQIKNEDIQILDAKSIWSLNTHQTTEELLKNDMKNAKVACIGPAGENLVKMACIINDKDRAIGRGGLGAVMGSKLLKAIVVLGSKKVKIASENDFKSYCRTCAEVLSKNPVTKTGLPVLGTAVLVNLINQLGIFPTYNFQKGVFDNAEGISGEKLNERFVTGTYACKHCPVRCGRKTKTSMKMGGGPEYETIWAFGAQCGIKDLEAIVEANYLCNELGLDTISTGSTIASAMELSEKGLIDEKLKFGDESAIIKYTEATAYRRGFGDLLAEGSYRLAQKAQCTEVSMSVKKLELPAYDPRGLEGLALAYATSNRGGCHLRAYTVATEVLGTPCKIDRFKPDGKPELVILLQNISAFIDSAIFCKFSMFALNPMHYANLISAATGLRYTAEDILKAGERIYNIERMFNVRDGFDKKHDTLPTRLTSTPLSEGKSKARVVNLNTLLKNYYMERGWDENGVPKASKLAELEIEKKD
jgi:aldehyde:ferredoxin oxidoreductase